MKIYLIQNFFTLEKKLLLSIDSEYENTEDIDGSYSKSKTNIDLIPIKLLKKTVILLACKVFWRW